MRLEALLIILLIIIGAMIYYKDGTFLNPFNKNNHSTSTYSGLSFDWFYNKEEEKITTNDTQSTTPSTKPASDFVAPVESPEIEIAVDDIYARLNELQEEARTNKLLAPVSPFAGSVTLKASGAKATDPNKEYLTLTVNSSVTNPIDITGWTIESYVTDSEAKIPKGARLLLNRTAKNSEAILLRAGEVAHLITAETPINVSFKANECSGYLTNYDSYTPTLKKSCALASDELLQFTNIKQSDDECYEFVADIKQCQVFEDDKLEEADLSGSCESFIEDDLTYAGCVSNHKDDPTFATGDWYIYLNKNGELWRSKKEIIRLLDKNANVVALVEY